MGVEFDLSEFMNQNCLEIEQLCKKMVSKFDLREVSVTPEDMAQEGFLVLWRRKEQYDPQKGDYNRWASTVLYNAYIDVLRRAKRLNSKETHIDDIQDRLDRFPIIIEESYTSEVQMAQAIQCAIGKAWEAEKSRTVRIGLEGICNNLTGRQHDSLMKKYDITKTVLNACISRARQRLKPFLRREGIDV